MLNTPPTSSRVSSGVQSDAPQAGRVAILAVGDLVVLLVFVVLGLSNHKETASLGKIVHTAAPFVLAWFVIAPWLGAFGRLGSAATTGPRRLFARTAAAWPVAWAAALILRGLLFRDDVTVAFSVVALLINAVLLLGWRGATSWLLWRQ